jgi:biofilm PGA synthesis N-glycosyltransferase PgaC
MFNVSLGVMAYNEEGNIGRLLTAILGQKLTQARLVEIIVVASGCTDRTEDIVEGFCKEDSRIRLIREAERKGKASAINLFLREAADEILVLESADTLPEEDTIDRLVTPFVDHEIGMTGARPIPINDDRTFIGFAVQLLWRLHHHIALIQPKLGELVAFRSFVREIPADSAVDEASIESIVRKAGYRLHYVPEAVVRNKGPETVRDFVKQRRRIAAGHLHLLRGQGHRVSTLSGWTILRALVREQVWGVKEMLWTIGVIGLEVLSRFLGWWDFCVRRKNPYIWEVAVSTKRLH